MGGQTYEILKMPFYCLYYYKQAQELRPSDSRMLVALGESYEKLDKIQDAMKCFWKAHCVGDIEGGIALLRLGRLYDGTNDTDEQSGAYKYLASYYLKQEMLNEAYDFAMKCTEFADVREEAKALLKEIASRRGIGGEGSEGSVLVEDP